MGRHRLAPVGRERRLPAGAIPGRGRGDADLAGGVKGKSSIINLSIKEADELTRIFNSILKKLGD
jgi:hypothetical protein